jgi:hypothetical protein
LAIVSLSPYADDGHLGAKSPLLFDAFASAKYLTFTLPLLDFAIRAFVNARGPAGKKKGGTEAAFP